MTTRGAIYCEYLTTDGKRLTRGYCTRAPKVGEIAHAHGKLWRVSDVVWHAHVVEITCEPTGCRHGAGTPGEGLQGDGVLPGMDGPRPVGSSIPHGAGAGAIGCVDRGPGTDHDAR